MGRRRRDGVGAGGREEVILLEQQPVRVRHNHRVFLRIVVAGDDRGDEEVDGVEAEGDRARALALHGVEMAGHVREAEGQDLEDARAQVPSRHTIAADQKRVVVVNARVVAAVPAGRGYW